MAKTARNSTFSTVALAKQGASEAVAAVLPSNQSLSRTVRNIRLQSNDDPIPKSLKDIRVPPSLRFTFSGQPFLFFDSGRRRNVEARILIFSTPKNLEYLRTSEEWQLDGTFKTAPQMFAQVYTVHARVEGQMKPMMYALLPRKPVGLMYVFYSLLSGQLDPLFLPPSLLTLKLLQNKPSRKFFHLLLFVDVFFISCSRCGVKYRVFMMC